MDEGEIAAWLRMKPTVTYLDDDEWERFMRALEEPPQPNEALQGLLNKPSIFESQWSNDEPKIY